MKKVVFFIFIYLISVEVLAQDNCQNFVGVGYPSCSCDDCGFLEPNWELLNQQSSVCEGLPFQVSGETSSPLSDIEDFHWYFIEPDGGTFTQLDHIILQDETPVSFTYNVTAANISCSQNSVSLWVDLIITSDTCLEGESCRNKASTIEVKLKPRAEFNVNQEVCITESVSFANTSCHAQDYIWDFGDGGSSTDENPDHIFATTGTFTVTLTAINECGEDQTTQQVVVIGEPVAEVDVQMSPPTGCLPLTVFFENISQNVGLPNQITSSYEWDITSSSGWQYQPDTIYNDFTKDINVQFFEPDEYLIELTIENICGTDTWDTTIVVLQPPTVSLASPGAFCETADIDFADFVSYTGSIFGYDWTITPPSGSSLTYDIDYPSGAFTLPGTYQVDLIVDGGPCGDFPASVTFEVQEPGTASFTNPPSILCTNDAPLVIDVTPMSGTWTSSPAGISIVNNTIDPSSINAGNYTLEFTPDGNCVIANSFNLTILDSPELSIAPVPVECDELIYEPNVNVDGEFSDITWTAIFADGSPNSSGMVTSVNALPNVTYNAEGENFYIITLDGDCGMISDTTSIEIQANTGISFTNPPSLLCTNDAPVVIDVTPMNGTWTSSPAGISIVNNTIDPSSINAGNYTLEFTPNGNCVIPNSFNITVLDSPELSIASVPVECDELIYVPNINADGEFSDITWTAIYADGSPNLSGVVANVNSLPNVIYNVEGENFYIITLDGNCGMISDTISIEIQANTGISITPPPSLLCNTSSPIQLVASPTTGTWEPSSIVSSDGVFDPSQTGAGIFSLTYSTANGACQNEQDVQITVIEAEPVTLEEDVILCVDSNPYTLTFDPPNGTWSGNGISDVNLGIFDPQSVGAGNYELTYELQDMSGCEVVKTTEVIVEDFPEIDLLPSATFCVTDENIDLEDILNLDVNPIGGIGTWFGIGIVDPTNGLFNSSQTDTGIFMITYTYIRNDCEVSDSAEITIIEAPIAEAGDDFSVCIDDGTFTLVGTPTGGTWSSSSNINPNTGEIDLIALGGGTFNFTYTVQPETTCEDADLVMVEIIDLTSNLDAGNDLAICEGDPAFQLSGFTPAGEGTWSGTGVSTTGMVATSQLQPDSTYTLSYCLENQNIGCEACDEILLTVNPLPEASFQITSTTCINEPIIFENLSVNACTYAWDFGDGNTSNVETPTYTYTSTGTYNITLTAYSCEDCIDVFQMEVFVAEPPTAFFDTDISEGCAVLAVAFDNQSFGTSISYFWDFGNGETSTEENPDTIFFQQANYDTTYIIELAVTNECGTIYHYDSITVFPLPVVIMGTNVDDGCSPLEIEFANLTLGNPETYAWYIDGVIASTDSLLDNQIFTTSDTAITYYEITLISNNFCGSDTLNKTITVYPPDMDAFMQVDTTKGCQPLTVTFTNFSTPGATITYDFGDGNGSSDENPVYTFNDAGIFTVYQYAANCGFDTDSIVIEVLPAPEVSFVHDPYVCQGQPITFTNTSINLTGGVWDFGDGSIDTLSSPTHIFADAGIYNISYTGYSAVNACPATFTSTLEVLGNPVVGFTPSVIAGCVPLTIDFVNTSVGTTYYEWQFDFGNSSNATNPTHTFNTPGTYAVTLIGTDDFGCFMDTSIVNIIVHEIPMSDFQTDAEEYCSGVDSIFVTNNSSSDAISYSWDFGNGQTYPDFEPAVWLVDTGEHIISLTVENAFGCQDVFSQTITVLGTPQAIISNPLNDFVGCEPLEINITNTSNFSNQYEWNFGNGNTSTDEFPSHVFLSAGIYAASLVAINTNGCPNDTLEFEVQVNPNPISDFELNTNVICGIPDSLMTTFTGSTDALDFSWTFGDGAISDETNPTHEYTVQGDYEVSLMVENIYGCLDTASQMIFINEQPFAEIDPFQYEGCEPDTIQFFSSDPFADSWQWSFGDGTFSNEENPLHAYPQLGLYEVELILGNNDLCFDTLTIPGAVNILESPTAFFTWTDMIKGFIEFTNGSANAIDYEWDFGDGNTSMEFNPTHEYITNGAKIVTLIATHENGCQAIYSAPVMPNYFYGLYVPNAFSPESGVGDVRLFKPAGIGLKNYHITVFSPWGELLWQSKEIIGEQPSESWDGYYKGKLMPQGAYVWKADVEFVNGATDIMTGTVILLK